MIHVTCNLIVRCCESKWCCQLDTVSSNNSESARSAVAATNDTAEIFFVAIGIHPCRVNIISDEDFQSSEITRNNEMTEENLEWTEDRNSNVDFPFVSVILFCPRASLGTHDNT
jgi:Tat protein secretion system quality control protein TatD with DNase activity